MKIRKAHIFPYFIFHYDQYSCYKYFAIGCTLPLTENLYDLFIENLCELYCMTWVLFSSERNPQMYLCSLHICYLFETYRLIVCQSGHSG